MRSNVVFTKITPWMIVSLGGSANADIFAPLSPVCGWAALVCTLAAGIYFILAARCRDTDPLVNPLRGYGNGLLVALVLGFGFAVMWSWQQIAGKPPHGVIAEIFPEFPRFASEMTGEVKCIRQATESTSIGIDRLNDSVKQEVSGDPRKELANMGLPWTAENFLKSIELGDRRAIMLFLSGGMPPSARTDQSVVFYAIVRGVPDFSWTVQKLVQYGLDIERPLEVSSIYPFPGQEWKTPLFVAAVNSRLDELRIFEQLGANTRPLIQEFRSLIKQIDAAEEERRRLQNDPEYCVTKVLDKSPKELAKMAQTFCLVDLQSCAEVSGLGRGFRHTAELWCQHAPQNEQSASYSSGPLSPSQRPIYVAALKALGGAAP